MQRAPGHLLRLPALLPPCHPIAYTHGIRLSRRHDRDEGRQISDKEHLRNQKLRGKTRHLTACSLVGGADICGVRLGCFCTIVVRLLLSERRRSAARRIVRLGRLRLGRRCLLLRRGSLRRWLWLILRRHSSLLRGLRRFCSGLWGIWHLFLGWLGLLPAFGRLHLPLFQLCVLLQLQLLHKATGIFRLDPVH